MTQACSLKEFSCAPCKSLTLEFQSVTHQAVRFAFWLLLASWEKILSELEQTSESNSYSVYQSVFRGTLAQRAALPRRNGLAISAPQPSASASTPQKPSPYQYHLWRPPGTGARIPPNPTRNRGAVSNYALSLTSCNSSPERFSELAAFAPFSHPSPSVTGTPPLKYYRPPIGSVYSPQSSQKVLCKAHKWYSPS